MDHVKASAPASERDRVERRTGIVFLRPSVRRVSRCSSASASSSRRARTRSRSWLTAFAINASSNDGRGNDVQPIRVPQTSCPYLRLVSTAATNAGAPWHGALSGPQAGNGWRATYPCRWRRSTSRSVRPSRTFPPPSPRDLRSVRRDVQVGRVQLLEANSVQRLHESVERLRGLRHARARKPLGRRRVRCRHRAAAAVLINRRGRRSSVSCRVVRCRGTRSRPCARRTRPRPGSRRRRDP